MATKKGYVIDERAWAIILDEFGDYVKYLSTPQDQKVYLRKIKEYKEKASVRMLEELNNGRTDDTAAN